LDYAELGLSSSQLRSMYGRMHLIRYFEDRVFELFSKGLVAGTTHLCQGQEAVSVGINSCLDQTDWITCTYRGHGHCLAKGMDPRMIMAEILGKETGCCKGKGGSMHITDFSKGILGSFAIVGAGIPVAAGAALSSWYRGEKRVAVSFFGDGAANIGAFHEGINMAAVMKLPVIFVCENNMYGEYTHISKSTAVPNIADRACSYNIPGIIVDGNDVLKVYAVAKTAIQRAREGAGPSLVECKTYRHKGHSRTDPAKYRPDSEVKEWLARDPLMIFRDDLVSNGVISDAEDESIKSEQRRLVDEAYQFAEESPYPQEKEVITNVFA
jgi:acetoin:2,6-dichlorophenolindophenol oxidoreductase subunit alpha